jgi:hypothetical protein
MVARRMVVSPYAMNAASPWACSYRICRGNDERAQNACADVKHEIDLFAFILKLGCAVVVIAVIANSSSR